MRFRYSMAMSPSDFAEIGQVVSTRNKYAHSGNSVRKIADNIKTYLRFFFLVADYVLRLGPLVK